MLLTSPSTEEQPKLLFQDIRTFEAQQMRALHASVVTKVDVIVLQGAAGGFTRDRESGHPFLPNHLRTLGVT